MAALAMLRKAERAIAAIDGNADERRLVDLALLAIAKAGLTQQAAARLYGVNQGTFCRQLQGQYGHHLSLLRLGKLPAAWRTAFARLLAEDCGLTVVQSSAGRQKRAARQVILELLDIAIGEEESPACRQSA